MLTINAQGYDKLANLSLHIQHLRSYLDKDLNVLLRFSGKRKNVFLRLSQDKVKCAPEVKSGYVLLRFRQDTEVM